MNSRSIRPSTVGGSRADWTDEVARPVRGQLLDATEIIEELVVVARGGRRGARRCGLGINRWNRYRGIGVGLGARCRACIAIGRESSRRAGVRLEPPEVVDRGGRTCDDLAAQDDQCESAMRRGSHGRTVTRTKRSTRSRSLGAPLTGGRQQRGETSRARASPGSSWRPSRCAPRLAAASGSFRSCATPRARDELTGARPAYGALAPVSRRYARR